MTLPSHALKPPNGVLLFGMEQGWHYSHERLPQRSTNFFKITSVTVDKHISESARAIREIFGGAEDRKTFTTIFMDEINAIGGTGRRLSEVRSTDCKIQRTLMEARVHFIFASKPVSVPSAGQS